MYDTRIMVLNCGYSCGYTTNLYIAEKHIANMVKIAVANAMLLWIPQNPYIATTMAVADYNLNLDLNAE